MHIEKTHKFPESIHFPRDLCYHADMTKSKHTKFRSCTDGLYRSRFVPLAALVLVVARSVSLIQLFQDAAARSKAGQAAPQRYTPASIALEIALLLVMLILYITVVRFRRRRSVFPRKILRTELNVITFAWSAVFIVRIASDMAAHSEIVYLVDIFALLTAMSVPSVLLLLSDREREAPDETVFMICGFAGTLLSVAAFLVFAVFDRKSYSSLSRLMPELLFRAGLTLFGFEVLRLSLRIRRGLCSVEPKRGGKHFSVEQETLRDEYEGLTEEEIAEVEAYRAELVRRKQSGEADWMAGFEAEIETPELMPDEPVGQEADEPEPEELRLFEPEEQDR